MSIDYRLTALERAIANRSTREYAKLGRGLSAGMRGLSARGLVGSSEQEKLLEEIAQDKAQVESESTAQRDMLRDQIKQEEEAKAGANLRNAFSIGGTLLGAGVGLALAAPTGGLSLAAGMSGGAGLGSALGKIVGGGATGTWDPTAANDIVTGFDALTKVDPIQQIGEMMDEIHLHSQDKHFRVPLRAASVLSSNMIGGKAAGDGLDMAGWSDGQYGAFTKALQSGFFDSDYGSAPVADEFVNPYG